MIVSTSSAALFTVSYTEEGVSKKTAPLPKKEAESMVANLAAEGADEGLFFVSMDAHVPAALRGPFGPKKMTARFEGSCPGCGTHNAIGSTIYYSKETGALCPSCGPKHYRSLGCGRTAR